VQLLAKVVVTGAAKSMSIDAFYCQLRLWTGIKGIRPGQYPSWITKLYEVGWGRETLVILVPGITRYC